MTSSTVDVANTECKRCKEPSVLTSRGEEFCRDCFIKFVTYKQWKKMEEFKVNYGSDVEEQQVLLPLSLGKSSVALLDMVVDLIRVQRNHHNGRQGFDIHAVHIDETGIHGFEKNPLVMLDQLRSRYPEVSITSVKLESFLEDPDVDLEELDVNNGSYVCSTTRELLTFLVRRTSQRDMLDNIKRQLIYQLARRMHCQTVVWGHCMTRLAELVISLTAKGRGQVISDYLFGEQSNPRVLYPLGEVLSSEVVNYNKLKDLEEFIVNSTNKPPATTKLQSIDELVTQYFVSVEEGFPSVVSTVVRTAAKLAPSKKSSKICAICGAPPQIDSLEWLNKITVNTTPMTHDHESRDQGLLEQGVAEMCYGCIEMFGDSSIGKVKWPRRSTKEDVLAEYLE
jgi:cytoplasmic tRNA 2-thiolation protein 2